MHNDKTVQTIHYQRQFLAPEQMRYDQSYCQSYVYLGTAPDDIDLETQFLVGDGHSVISLDFALWDDDYDAYLDMLTVLMNQMIAYRQAFAQAVALKRGQAVTGGSPTVEGAFNTNAPDQSPAP